MAKTFGEPSRNATEEAFKRSKRLLAVALMVIALLGFLGGYASAAVFTTRVFGAPWALLVIAILLVLIWLIGKWGTQKLDEVDRERMLWRKGAVGESLIAGVLEALPDEFVVIHGVSRRLAGVDHVVIGPTGVYVVDTKNWRGTIKLDGNGDLLLNGRRTDKTVTTNMLNAVKHFQAKLRAQTERNYFVRGLMVFPNAYVEGKFLSTQRIHCLRDERLLEYFQNMTFTNTLVADDIERIKEATLHLAGIPG